jgi:hypothetical protein
VPKWWLEQRAKVAQAIQEAEVSSGHQIVVHVGNLGRHPEKRASQLAVKWSGASLVFCVDPQHRHFEIRWSESLQLDVQHVTQVVTEPLRAHDLANAITALAALLPMQQVVVELPDIVSDDEN